MYTSFITLISSVYSQFFIEYLPQRGIKQYVFILNYIKTKLKIVNILLATHTVKNNDNPLVI